MALSRVTTWSSGQTLTAAALNGEFNNILNNPASLICDTSAPSKGTILVGNGTVSLGTLGVGTNDQVLTADSAQTLGVKWAAVAAGGSPAFSTITTGTNTGAAMLVGTGASLATTGTGVISASNLIFGSDAQGDIAVRGASTYGRLALATKGTILVGNGTTATSLAVGANDTVLTADSTQATGTKWAATGSSGHWIILSNATVGASSTVYAAPGLDTTNASENIVQMIPPYAGKVKNLRVVITNSQPASGSLVIRCRVNGTNGTVVVTIAAGSASGNYADTTNSDTFSVTQNLSFSIVNNATATSAQIRGICFEYQRT